MTYVLYTFAAIGVAATVFYVSTFIYFFRKASQRQRHIQAKISTWKWFEAQFPEAEVEE